MANESFELLPLQADQGADSEAPDSESSRGRPPASRPSAIRRPSSPGRNPSSQRAASTRRAGPSPSKPPRGPRRWPHSSPPGSIGLAGVSAPCVCPAHGTEYVRWVQSALNRIDGANLPVSGVMNALARSALRQFQRRMGLPVDGIAGPDTEQALRDAARPSGQATADPPSASAQDELDELETLALEVPADMPTVRRGSRGTAVADLQRRLVAAGFNAGSVDGIFGSNSDAAVRAFQQSRGLSVDGIAGPMTWVALLGQSPAQPGGGATSDIWVLPASVRAAGDAQTVRYDSPPAWRVNPSSCTGDFTAGAAELRQHILASAPGVSTIYGYSCRQNTGNPTETSVHGAGRALDIMIPMVAGKANRVIGDPIANWLVLNAEAIGVQYVIWNRVRWSGNRTPRVAAYTRSSPHIDHVHVELNNDGAARRTPWFQARAGVPSRSQEIMAGEVGFDSPTRLPRPVRASLVSCGRPTAAFAAVVGADPVATIGRANSRAIAMLDSAIKLLHGTRSRIINGAPAAAPTIPTRVRDALRGRFRIDTDVRANWTGTGARSIHVLIRRLRGARQILADGAMRYTCLGPATISLGGCTGPGCPPDRPDRRAISCGGHSRIVLCRAWWSDGLDEQAATLIHECFHIYFGFIHDGGNFGNAHCYEHLVLNLNGVAVPTPFAASCP